MRAERTRPAPLGASFRKVFAASVVSNLGDGVSTVGYPWLATAITRNPILVAVVAVAQRLPWLVFTLPAGVITDRVDRRRAMIVMDTMRGFVTAAVALAVLLGRHQLPSPSHLGDVHGTRVGLYLAVVLATLLLGMGEVLRDNSAQTILPAIVETEQLERANGRMWSAEGVMNTFVGPPLGSLLIAVAFALPFLVDAGSFFAAAALVALIPGSFRSRPAAASTGDGTSTSWRHELAEGVRWLWQHPLLRPMAIILGLMNGAGMISGATFVLFAQEVLHVGPVLFSVVTMGGALGGVIGGALASRASRRFGPGACLAAVLGVSTLMGVGQAVNHWWPVSFVLFGIESMVGILWNVITVSLRQSIIPEHLLGRVNSVYRFFAWGMMPIGAALGGLVVAGVGSFASRATALRATWALYAVVHVVLFVIARRTLTTAAIERARAAGPAPAGPAA